MASRPPPSTRLEPRAGERRIRLLIVDDSVVARTVLTRMLEPRAEFEVVGAAANVDAAMELLSRAEVDIILLDVEMPGTDGLTALPELLARSRGARVLIVSSAAEQGAEATMKALTLGAADTLLKPGAGYFAGRFSEVLVERLLRIGHKGAVCPGPSVADAAPAPIGAAAIECLALGASTGGVNALGEFFRALPRSFRAPILVTQHLPPLFMPYFAAQLQEIAHRPARVAIDGEALRPGELHVAPGDGHLEVVRSSVGVRVRIGRAAAASGCMPSVDPMFQTVARAYGAAAVGVVFSGMGRDGMLGAAHLVEAGGELLAQNAETSVVWGMPGAVVNAGLAAAVLSPLRIARRVGQQRGPLAWI